MRKNRWHSKFLLKLLEDRQQCAEKYLMRFWVGIRITHQNCTYPLKTAPEGKDLQLEKVKVDATADEKLPVCINRPPQQRKVARNHCSSNVDKPPLHLKLYEKSLGRERMAKHAKWNEMK